MNAEAERVHPERIRLTGLQEAQLAELVDIERACTSMYYEVGFDAAQIRARTLPDIVALTRNHNVHVAEADHVVAGYVAWRDEAPGVAFIEGLSVHPSFQRFGVGSRLLERVREEARAVRLGELVLCTWKKAPWAMAFSRRHGFAELDDGAPAHVRAWRDAGEAGRAPLQAGGVLLWAPVAEAPAIGEAEP
jgi:amino-acid N-acetyltransferase